jgi:hypothetical protein
MTYFINISVNVNREQSDIACHGLPRIGMRKHPGQFYLHVNIDEKTQKTSVARKSSDPSWDISLSLSVIYLSLWLYINLSPY